MSAVAGRGATQKRQQIVSQALRDSARGEVCTMRSSVCDLDTSTTVLCHSNYLEDGKGMGLKADDIFAFYGCSNCHEWYDRETCASQSVRRDMFHRAMKRTQRRMVELGLITVGRAK